MSLTLINSPLFKTKLNSIGKKFAILKRIGAWYYKTHRNFFELHKCCCFKLGCTFLIVLIQIFCNKKYSCPKNESFSEIEIKVENSQHKKTRKKDPKKDHIKIEMNQTNKKKKVSIEDDSNESVIFGEPQFNHPSLCKKTCFDIKTSEFQSPSFNLKSNQKSTPNRPCQNCESTFFPPNLSRSSPKITKKNLTDTNIDVHTQANDSDIQTSTSFHSCT